MFCLYSLQGGYPLSNKHCPVELLSLPFSNYTPVDELEV